MSTATRRPRLNPAQQQAVIRLAAARAAIAAQPSLEPAELAAERQYERYLDTRDEPEGDD